MMLLLLLLLLLLFGSVDNLMPSTTGWGVTVPRNADATVVVTFAYGLKVLQVVKSCGDAPYVSDSTTSVNNATPGVIGDTVVYDCDVGGSSPISTCLQSGQWSTVVCPFVQASTGQLPLLLPPSARRLITLFNIIVSMYCCDSCGCTRSGGGQHDCRQGGWLGL
jgi:hypothetical protein